MEQGSGDAARAFISGGWADVATEIHARRSQRPSWAFRLVSEGHRDILIDLAIRSHDGRTHPSEIASLPSRVELYSTLREHDEAPAFAPPGRDLDGLLWAISDRAFGDEMAHWRSKGEGYRIHRWPNLAEVGADAATIRLCAMLSTGFVAVDSIARSAQVELTVAHRVINALGLIGALDVSRTGFEDAVSSSRAGEDVAGKDVEPGFFGRLRRKLGF